jgi:single-strand DNA-binding protein
MTASEPELRPANEVYLRGRLADDPVEKELPSGDVLVVFRLTVPRPPSDRVRVDSIECVTSRARPRRTLAKAQPGMELEVEGSLRRRFWRAPNGPASRYAVDATTVRISSRRLADPPAGRRAGASPARTPASV